MDLLDFAGENLYFEEDLSAEVEGLLKTASALYGDGDPEPLILEALGLAPESLNVMVGAYRFYYYQHRLEDALAIADRALAITAARLGVPLDWRAFSAAHLAVAPPAMALLRFHLLSFKARAYLLLRLGEREEGLAILRRLIELDSHNRLGAKQLLEAVEGGDAD